MSHGFIPVPNCASVEMIYSYLGVTIENVFHVKAGAPMSLSDLQAVRTIFNNWDAATWNQFRGGACSLVRIRTRALDAVGSPTEDFFLPTPRGGVRTGTNLPTNVTLAIKFGSATVGRSFRGRIFMCGLNGDSVIGNQINAATLPLIISGLGTLKANLLAGSPSTQIVVVSYRFNKAWRTTGVATVVTTFSAVDGNLDSQRRRLTGRGRA